MLEKEDTIYLSSHINELYGVTEITQYYTNTLNSAIELSITFPILEDISLTKFIVTIGEKTISSKILSKEKAEQKYNDSISSGNIGIMSNYNNSLKSYTVNIGNIPPKQKVKLCSWFIQMIGANDMSYEFKVIDNYPTFTNINSNEYKENNKIIEANFNIETQSKITRLISSFMNEEDKEKSKYEVHFDNEYKRANIKYTKNFEDIKKLKPKHCFEDKINHHIFLSTLWILFRTEKMNSPILYYQYNEKLNETSYSINYTYFSKSLKSIPILDEPDQDNNISYYYKYQKNLINEAPGLFIFLIDQSGSMGGEPIELVKKVYYYLCNHYLQTPTFN